MKAIKKRAILISGAIISLLWGGILVSDLLTGGHLSFGNQFWFIRPPEHPERVVLLIALLTVYLVSGHCLLKRQKPAPLIALSIVMTATLSLLVIAIRHDNPFYELFARSASGEITGWFHSFIQMRAFDGGFEGALREWPRFMREISVSDPHIRLSPPGLHILFQGISALLEMLPALAEALARPLRPFACNNTWLTGTISDARLSVVWFWLLNPLWAGLAAIPLYHAGKALGDEGLGESAVFWWPLIPAVSLFSFYATPLYALFTSVILLALIRALKEKSWQWMLALGLLTSLFTFTSLAALPILAFIGFAVILRPVTQTDTWKVDFRWLFQAGLAFTLGFISVWAVYALVAVGDPLAILGVMFDEQFSLQTRYLPSLFWHLYEFFSFGGIFLSVIFAAFVIRVSQKLFRQKALTLAEVIGLAAAFCVILLTISGVSRGETGRVWAFLWPPLLILIVLEARTWGEKGIAIEIAWVFSLVILASTVVVADSRLAFASPTAESLPESVEMREAGDRFGETLLLSRYGGEIVMDDGIPTLSLWLEWDSTGWIDPTASLFATAVDQEGAQAEPIQIAAPEDVYPVSCFYGAVTQHALIPLPDGGPLEGWWVSLAIYNAGTFTPLDVTYSQGDMDVQIGIGPFSQR